MNAHVLLFGFKGEGSSIVGVYHTKESAETALEASKPKYSHSWDENKEWTEYDGCWNYQDRYLEIKEYEVQE